MAALLAAVIATTTPAMATATAGDPGTGSHVVQDQEQPTVPQAVAPSSPATAASSTTPSAESPQYNPQVQTPTAPPPSDDGATAPRNDAGLQDARQEEATTEPDEDRLRRVQIALIVKGYDPGAVDGILSSSTEYALKTFQKRSHIPQTGKADQDTLQRLGLSL